MLLAHKRMVEAFSATLVRDYPLLDIDDVRSSAWLCVVKAEKLWDAKGGTKFDLFLYRRLQWLRKDLIKLFLRRRRAEGAFAHSRGVSCSLDLDLDTLCRRALPRLGGLEQQMLRLLLCPPAEFLDFVKAQDRNVARRSRSAGSVCHFHYAKYLNTNTSVTKQAAAAVWKTIKELVNDR
jgi:hypothetical protein